MDRQALELLESQKRDWDLAGKNYEGLKKIEVKEYRVGNARFKLQFNPERIRSSAAKVDPKSIQERKCFLCGANLPAVQRGIDYAEGKYVVLVNPFPIFQKHLTIPLAEHRDQLISVDDRICDMLSLARELTSFALFYNGPKCGASAPDHFHFQAAEAGVMPVEADYTSSPREVLRIRDGVKVETIADYGRKVVIFSSGNKEALCGMFGRVMREIGALEPREPEAMINLIVRFYPQGMDGRSGQGEWYMFLFPRREHRPRQFFAEGEEQIVFSPASVDFGGLLIFPRREDFEKMTPDLIRDMFAQVSFSDEKWEALRRYIQQEL